MATEPQIDPESTVARMMAELQANPAARELLLRSMLTQEFLGLPARMEAVENRLERAENRLERAENRLERGRTVWSAWRAASSAWRTVRKASKTG